MKILTVLGARPQFIKAAAVSRAIAKHNESNQQQVREIILHTGQHFDANMSDVFFEQMGIPKPEYHLNINGLSHGSMTGRMLEEVEKVIQKEKPDWVLVYGDTNSTLAGALVAAKLLVPIAHVEAGLRSNNLAMPEEVNRVLTDRISSILFCPTSVAVQNLRKEGYPFTIPSIKTQVVENVGDVMLDVVLHYQDRACKKVLLEFYGLSEGNYALCTLHRQENTDDPKRMQNILKALLQISQECLVVLPLHPRTKKQILANNFGDLLKNFKVLEPLPYLEMQRLEMGARVILTDSGGIQKEAYFHKVPCITLREETEWVETVEKGINKIVGACCEKIQEAWIFFSKKEHVKRTFENLENIYGDGNSAKRIVCTLLRHKKN